MGVRNVRCLRFTQLVAWTGRCRVQEQTLTIGESVSSRVLSSEGVAVQYAHPSRAGKRGPRTQSRETVTDTEGRFEIVSLPPEDGLETEGRFRMVQGILVNMGATYDFEQAERVLFATRSTWVVWSCQG